MTEYIVDYELIPLKWRDGFGLSDVDLTEEVVRCKDCVYNAKDTDGLCYRFDHEHFNQPDGFCSWGKRKEVGE